MHLKVFMKLKKTLKTLSSGQKNPKKKNPKKPKKTQKNPLGWVFFKKTRVFSNPDLYRCSQQETNGTEYRMQLGTICTGNGTIVNVRTLPVTRAASTIWTCEIKRTNSGRVFGFKTKLCCSLPYSCTTLSYINLAVNWHEYLKKFYIKHAVGTQYSTGL
jgi:hypothetical protein